MDERVCSRLNDGEDVNRAPRGIDRYPCAGLCADDGLQDRNRGEQEGNIQPLQVMTPGRILLPVDITKCPLEVFSFINKFASEHRVTVILLHALNLNAMVPDNRVFDALSCLAGQQLKLLAERFLSPALSVRLRVRVGRPAQEILTEARESNVDLIILSNYGGCPFWKHPFQPRTVEKVLRSAPCNATLLRVRTCFNCEEALPRMRNPFNLLQPENRHKEFFFGERSIF
jgi:nucleotide-binding universal stress UspA family protein